MKIFFRLIGFCVLAMMHFNNANAQCFTTSTPTSTCSWGDAIDFFSLNGVSTTGNYGCTGSGGYSFFSTPVRNLNIGSTVPYSVIMGTSGSYTYSQGFAIWIDLNNNGQYEASECLLTTGIGTSFSGTITIPSSATPGTNIRMRTRCKYFSTLATTEACSTLSWGETEDYFVNLIGASPCTGTPAPGNTLASANPVCPNQSFTLSLQNTISGTGVTYQWQTSPNSITWTNATGTGTSFTTSQTAATWYRCAVTCSNSSSTGFSNPVQVNMNNFLSCYCAANYTSGCAFSDVITNVVFGTMSNPTGCTPVPASTDYGGSVAAPVINMGVSTPISVTVGAGGSEHVAVWIDYNQNGVFETTEYTYIGRGNGTTLTNSINVPGTATSGITKMRVRVRYSTATTPQILATDPCTTFSWGETEDYNVNLQCVNPVISSHPSSATLCSGNNVTFSVAATGSGVTYQWQENSGFGFTNITNGGVYSGATSANLTLILPPATFNGYQYRCVAGISCGSATVTSNIATLNLGTTTNIIGNPPNQTVCNGAPTTFTVNAVASNITYQWQYHDNATGYYNLSNGGIYSNVNGPTLNISSVSPAINNYSYRCVITGSCPPFSMTSAAGTLTVGSGLPIISQPSSIIVCAGTNSSFTVTGGSSGISHQWQVNTGSGYTNVANGGVYSGATTATLNLTGTPLSFSGYQYRCVLSNSCTTPVFSNAASLTVNQLPVITTQPTDVSSCDFQTVNFSVATSGTGLTYQWQINTGLGFFNLSSTPPYTGALGTNLSIANVNSGMNGYQYRCIVSGSCTPAVTSNVVTLTILNRPVITSNPTTVTVCANDNTSFSVAATGTALTYQWQMQTSTGSAFTNVTNGGVFAGATTPTLTLTGVPNTLHSAAFRCVVGGTCAPVATSAQAMLFVNSAPTVAWQPLDRQVCVGGSVTFTTNGTAATIVGSLSYQWQVNTGAGFTNLANGAPYSAVTTPNLVISGATTALNGYTYRCVISNSTCLPTAITNAALLTVNTLPAITNQPNDITVCPGSNATFNIAATGTGIAYQWQVNTGSGYNNLTPVPPYTGANNPTLLVTGVTPNMHGYLYRCVVRGVCSPNATSAAVRLNVHNPIVINSQSVTDTFCEGGTSRLGVRVTGAGVLYQWQIKEANGSYTDLVNIPPYSGVNTDSLRFSGTPATFNGNVYRCAITETILCNLWFYTADIPVGVRSAPAVSPASITTPPLHVIVFTVPNGGTSYQWQEDDNKGGGYRNLAEGTPYKGVYTNTLIIDPIQLSMTGNKYRCIIDGVCVSTVTSKSAVLNIDPSLSISNVKTTDNSINVYPNPLSGTDLNIVFKKDVKSATDIKVMDKLGKVVYKTTVTELKNNIATINLQALAAGVYMIQVMNAEANISETIQFTKQ